ncbi:MAG: PBP1A family penicillin-binding protein [Mariprofundaceae bacterium]|nr:PBP1A family penicillin-binding protein [Mariprofundaceae bacterium]
MIKIFTSLTLFAVIAVTIGYVYFSSNLPSLTKLSDYQPKLASRVFNTQGQLLAEYADEHRLLTPFNEIPKQLIHAFLAAEDQQFYEHPGINPARIASAALANIHAGHKVQGGSTITQQVAKNFLLTSEKTYIRKIKEIILAYRIEQTFSKDDILYLYLNQIYLGRGSYGVASAAWRYFGKTLDELTLSECAMLAGLPKAPGKYAPHLNMNRAIKRRNLVLYLMKKSGLASAHDVDIAKHEKLHVAPLPKNHLVGAYGNEIYRQLVSRFGLKTLRQQGLTIIVPYDEATEKKAIQDVRNGVLDVENRQFYRTPKHHPRQDWAKLLQQWKESEKHISLPLAKDQIVPALVKEVQADGSLTIDALQQTWLLSKPKWHWEKAQAGNQHPRHWITGDEIVVRGDGKGGIQLSQQPSIESALYAIDLKRGTVLARVGGFNFKFSGFDRVSEAKRQPGSAFKPLLYATAMEHGFTPASIIMDTPIVFGGGNTDNFWRPENYKNKFAGPVTLRDALEHSRNLSAIKLLQDVGIRTFINKLRDFPFSHDFPPQLAIALGATEVSPQELTEAYIPLASGGKLWKPVSIQQVQDHNGHTLLRQVAGHRCLICHVDPVLSAGEGMHPAKQILDPQSAFLATNMLEGVIQRGTGRRARILHRPAAGKTGTTNKQVDAWFIGYTPQVLTGVWTGRDTPSPMGRRETGAHAALPTWIAAMQDFHQHRKKEAFSVPDGIEWVMINRKNGKLASPTTTQPFLESFREGTAPKEMDKPVLPSNTPDNTSDFFNSDL